MATSGDRKLFRSHSDEQIITIGDHQRGENPTTCWIATIGNHDNGERPPTLRRWTFEKCHQNRSPKDKSVVSTCNVRTRNYAWTLHLPENAALVTLAGTYTCQQPTG
jgi:hypothetical protein